MRFRAPRWGIRAQLLVLVAGALLPLIFFVAWTLAEQHDASRAKLRAQARQDAVRLRDAIDSHLNFAEGVLASLVPLAARSQGVLSAQDLDEVLPHLPRYTINIMAFDPAGRMLSSHQKPSTYLAAEGLKGRPLLDAALASPGVAVTHQVVGRTSGRELINTALAYPDAKGRVAGVLVLTTSVPIFQSRILDTSAAPRETVGVISLDGTLVMVANGVVAIDVAKQALGREGLQRALSEGELDFDGARHAFGSARTLRAPWTVVVVGDNVFAEGEARRLAAMFFAAFAAFAAGLAAALWISRRITRPFLDLHDAATTFAKGHLQHRVRQLSGEAGAVGRALNTMAAELEGERAKVRSDAERFRAVFHHCPLPMGISDLGSGRVIEVNEAFSDLTGRAAADVVGKTSTELGIWVDAEQLATAAILVEREGRVEGLECRHRMADGRVLDMLFFAEALEIGGRRVMLSQAVDVSERKRAERKLHEVSKRLRLATRSARIGIWDLDLRTNLLVWDESMLDLYGLAAREFTGYFDDWIRRVHTGDREAVSRCHAQALEGKADVDMQYRIVHADGSVHHVRSSASVERDGRGAPIRLTGTSLDVTEGVVAREALARVNSELEARVVARTGELEETVRELEAFSYTVAHDLRAPLRAIDGFSSCLGQALAESPSHEATSLLSKIRRNVGSMDRLIDGLLNYARLGRQEVRGVAVDMTALARDSAAMLADTFPDTEVTIDPLPGTFGDPEMLRQVWQNLIGNACKFSAARPTPRVAIGSTTDSLGTVYYVWDNGVGFDMRYRDRLFRVFERLHTDPEFGGTGVGLAVVQRIVQRHAGAAWAEGFPGEGATFYFRLPDAGPQ